MLGIAITVFIAIIIFKLFKINNKPEKSTFYSANAQFIEQILKVSPKLSEPYIPTRLWGYSGHIQTIVESVIKIFPDPISSGERLSFRTPDGATVTYDFYQPCTQITNGSNITLAVLPGAYSSSKSRHFASTKQHVTKKDPRRLVIRRGCRA